MRQGWEEQKGWTGEEEKDRETASALCSGWVAGRLFCNTCDNVRRAKGKFCGCKQSCFEVFVRLQVCDGDNVWRELGLETKMV